MQHFNCSFLLVVITNIFTADFSIKYLLKLLSVILTDILQKTLFRSRLASTREFILSNNLIPTINTAILLNPAHADPFFPVPPPVEYPLGGSLAGDFRETSGAACTGKPRELQGVCQR